MDVEKRNQQDYGHDPRNPRAAFTHNVVDAVNVVTARYSHEQKVTVEQCQIMLAGCIQATNETLQGQRDGSLDSNDVINERSLQDFKTFLENLIQNANILSKGEVFSILAKFEQQFPQT